MIQPRRLRVGVLFSAKEEQQLIRALRFLSLGLGAPPPASECLTQLSAQDSGWSAGPEFLSWGLHQPSPGVCKQSVSPYLQRNCSPQRAGGGGSKGGSVRVNRHPRSLCRLSQVHQMQPAD